MSNERLALFDRERVVDTALKLLNEVGLDGLTLRVIARELDVPASGLYTQFKDKQALLDEMATEMCRRMTAEATLTPGADWHRRLLEANRGLRSGLLRYRDGAKVFGGSHLTGLGYVPEQEEILRLLTEAGFTLAQAVRAASTAFLYTLGFVADEQGVEPFPGQRREGYDLDEITRALDGSGYPLSAEAGSEIFTGYDEHYEEGLALVMAGIEARYGKS